MPIYLKKIMTVCRIGMHQAQVSMQALGAHIRMHQRRKVFKWHHLKEGLAYGRSSSWLQQSSGL